ncbi:hypothetical protein HaLaN_28568, partial [Haematococcus lacustris]
MRYPYTLWAHGLEPRCYCGCASRVGDDSRTSAQTTLFLVGCALLLKCAQVVHFPVIVCKSTPFHSLPKDKPHPNQPAHQMPDSTYTVSSGSIGDDDDQCGSDNDFEIPQFNLTQQHVWQLRRLTGPRRTTWLGSLTPLLQLSQKLAWLMQIAWSRSSNRPLQMRQWSLDALSPVWRLASVVSSSLATVISWTITIVLHRPAALAANEKTEQILS